MIRRNPWDNPADAERMREGMRRAARKRAPAIPESSLQQHVVKLLQAYARPDIAWWSCPNGELRNWKVGVKLKAAGLRAGASDLMLLIDGHFHALELKTEVGVASGKQLKFGEAIERAGGSFHIAFGLDQAIGVLRAIGAFRDGITFSAALGEGCVQRGAASVASRTPVTSETGAPA